jgi:hypothetical protein
MGDEADPAGQGGEVMREDRLPLLLRVRGQSLLEGLQDRRGHVGGPRDAGHGGVVGRHRAPGRVEAIVAVGHGPVGLALVQEGREPFRHYAVEGMVGGRRGLPVVLVCLHPVQQHLRALRDAVLGEPARKHIRVNLPVLPRLPEDARTRVAPPLEQLLGLLHGAVEGPILEAHERVGGVERLQGPERPHVLGRVLDAGPEDGAINGHCTVRGCARGWSERAERC